MNGITSDRSAHAVARGPKTGLWISRCSDVSFVLKVNDRRTQSAPGLFLARPVVRCRGHILNESTLVR